MSFKEFLEMSRESSSTFEDKQDQSENSESQASSHKSGPEITPKCLACPIKQDNTNENKPFSFKEFLTRLSRRKGNHKLKQGITLEKEDKTYDTMTDTNSEDATYECEELTLLDFLSEVKHNSTSLSTSPRALKKKEIVSTTCKIV